jgi:hypothetical protein
MEDFMKTLAFMFSAALCFTALPAAAGSLVSPDNVITLAQADVHIGPGGVTIDRDRDRDRDHERRRDRDRERAGEGRDHDRNCRTVTVEEDGRTRTTRQCD